MAGRGLLHHYAHTLACRGRRPFDNDTLALAIAAVGSAQLVGAFDQHLDGAANPTRCAPPRDLSLQGQQVVDSPALLVSRNVVGPAVTGVSSGPGRVLCQMDDVELDFLHQAPRVQELLLGLAGEPDYDVRIESDVRHEAAGASHDLSIAVDPVPAGHPFEDQIVT